MPRKIHDDAELDAVQEIIDVLAVLPTRTPDQNDYLETKLARHFHVGPEVFL